MLDFYRKHVPRVTPLTSDADRPGFDQADELRFKYSSFVSFIGV
jgi:hypothetical protein